MAVEKTYAEINEKIKKGEAVVVTAEEIIDLVREKGIEKAAREVDVVTTGTFGTMCSSGAFLNFGHSRPRIKMNKVYLNGVPAYAGLAAVDAYIGATALPDSDPENRVYPGRFLYGGGHVIEDLVAGKEVKLEAFGYGTDCYPRRHIETRITLESINEAFLFNPRNAYQNYAVAVNLSDRTLYTYMGVLKPRLGNASYSTSGQLSPLLNDPFYKTIGVGTRIFLGGGIGYVAWHGTQHNPCTPRGENGVPLEGAGTLAVIGDLKQMSPAWLRGVSYTGYGASLAVGIGIPIPILNEEILRYTAVSDADILAPVIDYSSAYPERDPEVLCRVSYAELRSGRIVVRGKEVPTTPLSSYAKAREIALILKEWIEKGRFLLAEPVQPLPSAEAGIVFKGLEERNNNR
ncbi:MAG: L-aspartate semialdehyde sulfurtransferase [Clostridia bacterium]|nr:L-aspartate semialdehyde sulfurtransferase [Clostridia bacterium]MDN5366342.1 L-aspartate semialdehyde sulfurtransferase [Thermacetogenium sp.]